MSGRDERPKKKEREETTDRSRYRRAVRRRRPEREDEERAERRPNPFTIFPPRREAGRGMEMDDPAQEQRLRDMLEQIQGTPEQRAEAEEGERMREAADTERQRMRVAMEGRARLLADEMIVFIRERPEMYTLPMAARGFVAIAQMLDADAPQDIFFMAANICMNTLNHTEGEEEDEDGVVYDIAIRRSEELFTPPPPPPEVMAEMTARLPIDRDNVVTFINERPDFYPLPVEPRIILGVFELLGIEGPDFYIRLLLADVIRNLRPQL